MGGIVSRQDLDYEPPRVWGGDYTDNMSFHLAPPPSHTGYYLRATVLLHRVLVAVLPSPSTDNDVKLVPIRVVPSLLRCIGAITVGTVAGESRLVLVVGNG